VQQENCLACHALGDTGGSVGPRLEWIGGRRDADAIARYLADPEKASPGSKMPPFPQLTEAQRMLIGQFIVSLAADRRTP
jgi:nitric oxide reductase subunit C